MSRLPRLPAAVRWTVPRCCWRPPEFPGPRGLVAAAVRSAVQTGDRPGCEGRADQAPARAAVVQRTGTGQRRRTGAVLAQVRPRFDRARLRANYVEHALRAWGIDAEFGDPEVMSGAAMKDFLVDHGKFLASWGPDIRPLLIDQPQGVGIRWGDRGVRFGAPRPLAGLPHGGRDAARRTDFHPLPPVANFKDALQQGLRDFRLDERETEWSAMAFGLWIAPVKSWQTGDGRTLSFDLLAQRLIRGHKRFGVCSGTHRLYSLMLLYRLDDDHGILSPSVKADIRNHLLGVRQNIIDSQFEDGAGRPTGWRGKSPSTNRWRTNCTAR